MLPSEVLCLKTSPLTEGASGRCAAHSLLFVPLPKRPPPVKVSAIQNAQLHLQKHPQCNPHPTPWVCLHLCSANLNLFVKKGLLNCVFDLITQTNDSATHYLKKLFSSLIHVINICVSLSYDARSVFSLFSMKYKGSHPLN